MVYLTKNDRTILKHFAHDALVCPAERDAEAAAIAKMRAVIDDLLVHLCPVHELDALRAIDVTTRAASVDIENEGDKFRVYLTRSRELPDWVTSRPINLADTPQVPAGLADAVMRCRREWTTAAVTHQEVHQDVLEAVRASVDRAATLEELVKVWPAAARLRAKLEGADRPPTPPPSFRERIAKGRFDAADTWWFR